jgi:hypothetical protein
MTVKQRKYLECWTVLALLLATVWYFQDDTVLARLAFVPAAIYYLINLEHIRALEQVGPSPIQVIQENRFIRGATIGMLGLEIVIAYSSLISGFRIDGALQGFGMLMLVVLGPLLPATIVSQLHLYRRLADEKF